MSCHIIIFLPEGEDCAVYEERASELCARSNFVHTSELKVDVHVGYLQGVLNAVGEVLEGAQRDGFIRP